MTDLQTKVLPEKPAQPAPRVTPRSRPRRVRSVIRHAILLASSLLMIYPLLWMVVSSLRPNAEIFRNPSLWPLTFNVQNYIDGWNALSHPFSHYLMNSTILVLGCVIGNLFACTLTAYAFARLKFWGRNIAFAIMLLTLMLPIHVVIVPQYIMFSQTGWVNTMVPLILPKFLATDAFFIFLMVQFIRGIPKELDEAARIDGAGHFRIFFQVVLPLMLPALATTTIFTFMWMWNDFFGSLIYLTTPEMFTVPLALRSFLDTQGTSNWGAMFSMSVLSLIPLFIVFLIGQKFLVRGFATTGIK
ncbi:MAG: carbohydrate ABC transporter permease [Brachybacterium sp.]|nr:carbohydrate ABC transporter permease [Brachybacterium sp.]